MCGLFGAYSNDLNEGHKEGVRLLGFLSALRGIDSTGILCVGETSGKNPVFKHCVSKDIQNPVSFLSNERNQAFMDQKLFNKAVIGHCRWPTQGDTNHLNAQPLKKKHIIGVHNGTVIGFAKGKHSDSHAVFDKISQQGLQATVDEAGAEGAMALVWTDKEKNTLNFFRNTKRTLWFMRDQRGSVVYWASEKWMLEVMSDRTATPFKDPSLFPTHLHTVVDLTTGKSVDKAVEKPTPYFNLTHYKHLKSKDKAPDAKQAPLHQGMNGRYQHFKKRIMSLIMADYFLQEVRCFFCNAHHAPEETVYWFDDEEYICKFCVENYDVGTLQENAIAIEEAMSADLYESKVFKHGGH